MRILGRLILVPIALIFATLVTMLVLVSIGQERVIQSMGGSMTSPDAVIDFSFVLLDLGRAVLSGPFVALPLIVAIAGEVSGIRRAAFYVVAGGLILVSIPLAAGLGKGAGLVNVLPVFATAGFAGGFVYWLLAGRTA